MCTCNSDINNNNEEYYTAFSELDIPPPENWRTSTRYPEDYSPEYRSTPRRTVQDYQHIPRRTRRSRTVSRRLDLTTGVAIVPRRIEFDARSDVEDIVEDEIYAREPLERPSRRWITEPTGHETYTLRRSRATQYPMTMQSAPRLVKITPCGKCLRI